MADCQACHKDKGENKSVPYIVHEAAAARSERTIKRLLVAFLIVIAAWFATVVIFVWHLDQYDFESYAYQLSTEGGGNANFIGQDGDIYNGANSGTQDNS